MGRKTNVAMFRAVALAVAGVLALTLMITTAFRRGSPDSHAAYQWGFFYYMPYDNDLGHTFEPAIEQIQAGIGANTVAVIYADLPRTNGLHRVVITAAGIVRDTVEEDDSASVDTLLSGFDWFRESFRCSRTAVVLMGHGGSTTEMCFDRSPEGWMSAAELGSRLRRRPPCDLLFLQQCGRASIQNLRQYRGVAEFVLASPIEVSAWDPFLTPMHRWLEKNPQANGQELAEVICKHNEDFAVYVLIDGERLDELEERSSRLPELRLAGAVKARPVYRFGKTRAYDLGDLPRGRGIEESYGAFIDWIEADLIVRRFRGDRRYSGRIGLTFAIEVRDED